MTSTQKAVYDALTRLINETGRAPHISALAADLQKSPSTVHGHLKSLLYKGHLVRRRNKDRYWRYYPRSSTCPTCGGIVNKKGKAE